MFASEFLKQRTNGSCELRFGKGVNEDEIANHDNGCPSYHRITGLALPFAKSHNLLTVSKMNLNGPPVRRFDGFERSRGRLKDPQSFAS